MNEVYYSITSTVQLNFYDMILFILDKIIIISSWEQAKEEDEVRDYFYGLFNCMIELLIEIIQGSDASNFNNFFNDEIEDEKSGNENKNEKKAENTKNSPLNGEE